MTTLSIFSAIVLTFAGGLSFEKSIIDSMAAASLPNLMVTISLTGFVLFNTIYMLLHIIIRLNSRKSGIYGMIIYIVINLILFSTLCLGLSLSIGFWGVVIFVVTVFCLILIVMGAIYIIYKYIKKTAESIIRFFSKEI